MRRPWSLAIAICVLALFVSFASQARRRATPPPDADKERPLMSMPYSPGLDPAAMDRSADPCVDFYAFSCGGWVKSNPIPPDQARWSVYGKLGDANLRFLWGALEKASAPRPDRSVVEREIGDYFAACMDEAAVDKAGTAPIAGELATIDGLRSIAQLGALAGKLGESHSGRMLFGWGSGQDFGDSQSVIAQAYAGGLGLPDRDYYVKTDKRSVDIRARYVEHVAEMLTLSGEPAAAARTHARDIMALETTLARATLTRVERRNPYNLYHKQKTSELMALVPSFDWRAYLAAAGGPTVAVVNVDQPKFFQTLESALKTVPLATWKEYLRWHAVSERAPYLSSKLATASFEFYSHYLRGVATQPPRWKRCVRWVDRDLGEALGQIFVQRTFGPDVRQRTVSMTVAIEKAMADEIATLSWMGADTKGHALEKLRSIVNKVGYPDKWRDYSSVRIARDDLAGNVVRAAEFETRRELDKIGRPLDRTEWGMTPPTVNAYYDAQMNDINFPAGVLQPPLFDAKMDDAPNYGDTGGTIGHELTHGFDDEGRQFDARGNLKDWWTNSDAAEFEKRTSCIVDQYGRYPIVDDIKINSKLTLGEDVADLGGTLIAYKAWKTATRGHKLKAAAGLTPEQRFFVGYAQWACENVREESLRVDAVTNPHSPGKYRVNGVVANMPEFAAAFSCKPGQPMVRENVCRVW